MLQIVPMQHADAANTLAHLARAKASRAGAAEIWVGEFPGFGDILARRLVKNSLPMPLFANVKTKAEGGNFSGSPAEKLARLTRAARAGFQYIDADADHTTKDDIARLKAALVPGASLLLSRHCFDATPTAPKLELMAKQMLALGAQVIKIAAMCHSAADAARLVDFGQSLGQSGVEHIVLGMGAAGIPTRTDPRTANMGTFVALTAAERTAPGQPLLSAHGL